MAIYIGNFKPRLYIGNAKVKKAYIGTKLVYSCGSTVTYHVDSDTVYTEEKDEGASVLSPATFTPSKNGWTFAGWRKDQTASGSVLGSLTMTDTPITLYAVFRQTVTVTYYNKTATAASEHKYRYYNNGNITNPAFTLTQANLSGWTARGWSTGTAGNSTVNYGNSSAFTRSSSITLYGMYQQSVTLTYYNGSSTAHTKVSNRYLNSNGNIVDPAFTISAAALSGWTFNGWCSSASATADIAYPTVSGTKFPADTTIYAKYSHTVVLSYNGNNSTSGNTLSQTGTRYFNSGNYSNPAFTLQKNGFSRDSAVFKAWAMDQAEGTWYTEGSHITLSANTTMYAVWSGISKELPLDSLHPNYEYLFSYDTHIPFEYTRWLWYEQEIDCSLYSGIQITVHQAFCKTTWQATGFRLGIYEAGGNFQPICYCWRDHASVSNEHHAGNIVPDGGTVTLTFKNTTGKTKLYVGIDGDLTAIAGTTIYTNAYGNGFLWVDRVTLIGR